MIASSLTTSEQQAAAFAVPRAEHDEFYRLPDTMWREIKLYLNVLKRMAYAPAGKQHAIAIDFHRAMNRARGSDPKSLYRKLKDFVNAGYDWRVLIDRARLPAKRISHPPEFLEYWKGLYESNQRTCPGAAAHRELVKQFQKKDASIPGYGTWRDYWQRVHPHAPLPPTCPESFVPAAWDYATLIKHKPERAEKALASYGIAAATKQIQGIPGTRDGLRFLEWIYVDDVRTDFLVCLEGVDVPMELKCLVAYDFACAMVIRIGGRPALPREDGTKQGLIRYDTKTLLAGVYNRYGIPREYISNVVMERGTATMNANDAAAIAEATGGQCLVHLTEMIRGTALLGGFMDRSLGNPNSKAPLESYFNPLHNDLGFLPGQIGSNYGKRPAEIEGRTRELRDLVKAGEHLIAPLRLQLRVPFHSYGEALVDMWDVVVRHAARKEHDLEGFERVRDWRWRSTDATKPHAPWMSMSEYPVGLPPGAEASIELSPWRMESPIERMMRLVQGVTFDRPAESSMRLFLDKHHDFVTVDKHAIILTIEGRDFIFYESDSPLLQHNGTKYLAYYSRADLVDGANLPDTVSRLDCLYLTDGKGAYKGRLPLDRRIRKSDVEALAARIKQKEHALKVLQRNVSSRPQNVARMAEREANLDKHSELFRDGQAIDVAPITDVAGTRSAPGMDALANAEAQDVAERSEADQRIRSARKVSVVGLMAKKKPGVAQ